MNTDVTDNKTICRSFTLYNNKILSDYYVWNDSFNKELNQDYLTIGFFDAFSTQPIEYETNNNAKTSIYPLYEHIEEITRNLNGQQSYQNVYGFRKDNLGNNADNIFWDKSDNLPLIMVSFWQIKAKNYNEVFNAINNILTNYTFNKNNLNYIVYTTLDKSNFIVCFRSNNYTELVNSINELYTKLDTKNIQVIYSYSNLVVKVKDFDNVINKITDEVIDSISIKTVINHNIDIDKKIKYYCQELSKHFYGEENFEQYINEKKIVGCEILGDNDCRLIAREVSLKKIIELFKSGGLLNRENENFQYCFLSSMTSLNIDKNNCIFDKFEYNNKLEQYFIGCNNDNNIFTNDTSKVLCLKSKIENITNDDFKCLKTPLYNLLHCLRSMELSKYQQSELNTLIPPTETAINLFEKLSNKTYDDNSENSELFDFLDKIIAITQGAMRTDIRLYQILDYSIMTYYAPSHLRIFYSKLVNEISEYYLNLSSDKKYKYSFIIYHGTDNKVTVNQVWREIYDDDKLMTVHIPECDLYNIKGTIFTLAHEVAHFVGNENIRKRELRFKKIVKTILKRTYKLYCYAIREKLKTYENSYNSHYYNDAFNNRVKFDALYSKQYKHIKYVIKRGIKAWKKDNNINNDYYKNYSNNICKIFQFIYNQNLVDLITTPLVESISEEIYNSIVSNARFDIKDLNEYNKLMNDIKSELKNKWIEIYFKTISSPNNYLEKTLYIAKESYADLSAVFLLNVSVEDYFNSIFLNLKTYNFDTEDEQTKAFKELSTECIFIRCALVTKALAEASQKNSFSQLNSFNKFISDKKFIEELFKNDREFNFKAQMVYKYITEEKLYFDDWKYIYEYLKYCAISYFKYNNHASIKRKEIIGIYNDVTSQDLFDCVNTINDYITETNDSIPD